MKTSAIIPMDVELQTMPLLDEAGLGGNLATDALIAAHAEDYGATVYSTDRDFARSPVCGGSIRLRLKPNDRRSAAVSSFFDGQIPIE